MGPPVPATAQGRHLLRVPWESAPVLAPWILIPQHAHLSCLAQDWYGKRVYSNRKVRVGAAQGAYSSGHQSVGGCRWGRLKHDRNHGMAK